MLVNNISSGRFGVAPSWVRSRSLPNTVVCFGKSHQQDDDKPTPPPAGFWTRIKNGVETVLSPVLMLNSGYRMGKYAEHNQVERRGLALDMALALNSQHLTQGKRQQDILEKLSTDPDESIRFRVLTALPELALPVSTKVDLISRQLSLMGNVKAKHWVLSRLTDLASPISKLPKMMEIALCLARHDASPEIRGMVLKSAVNLPSHSPEVSKMLLMEEDASPAVANAYLGFVLARMRDAGDVSQKQADAILDRWVESPDMGKRWAVLHKLFVWPMTLERRVALMDKMEEMCRPELRQALVNASSMLPDELAFKRLWRYSLNLNYHIRRTAAVHLANLSNEEMKLKLLALAARDPQPSVREAARQTAQIAFQTPEFKAKAAEMVFEQP